MSQRPLLIDGGLNFDAVVTSFTRLRHELLYAKGIMERFPMREYDASCIDLDDLAHIADMFEDFAFPTDVLEIGWDKEAEEIWIAIVPAKGNTK